MTISVIGESQRKVARDIGFTYPFAMVTANHTESNVRASLIVHCNCKSIFDDEALTQRAAAGFEDRKKPVGCRLGWIRPCSLRIAIGAEEMQRHIRLITEHP
jgi:hypothetical protein